MISLATLTYGLVEFSQIEQVVYCPGFYCLTNHAVLSFLAFVVSGSNGIAAIINMIVGFEIQRKSIYIFNQFTIVQSTPKNNILLNIGIQKSGIGLALIF